MSKTQGKRRAAGETAAPGEKFGSDRPAVSQKAPNGDLRSESDQLALQGLEPIAVVGMAARLPGAPDVDAYWDLLCRGETAFRELPETLWGRDLVDPSGRRPGTTRGLWAGFLGDIERFDGEFFGLDPDEAAAMDPQHRLFLQEAWRALEDAGCARRQAGRALGGRDRRRRRRLRAALRRRRRAGRHAVSGGHGRLCDGGANRLCAQSQGRGDDRRHRLLLGAHGGSPRLPKPARRRDRPDGRGRRLGANHTAPARAV